MPTRACYSGRTDNNAAEKAPSEGALEASGSVANPSGTTKREGMLCGLADACTRNRDGVVKGPVHENVMFPPDDIRPGQRLEGRPRQVSPLADFTR